MTALSSLLLWSILLQAPAAPTNPSLSVLHVVITAPTASPTYNAGSATELTTLAGTATSSQTITGCTWTNSLGGGGSATGTTSWSVSSIALADGDNVITVTCTTNGGVQRSDVVTVSSGTSEDVSVNLTVQEAIYAGGSAGVDRTDEPVTVGIPLPDGEGCQTDTSNFGLTGSSAGQFRALGHWESGCIKWVLVDGIQDSLSAGATSTDITLTNTGSGNFGGSDLATDTGSAISVATGACTFTIKESGFNGFDQVTCGAGPTTVVSSGASQGLVLKGPAYDGSTTSCGTCNTEFTSANDSSTSVTIEENGPVRAVIKAMGSLKDGSGNTYMKFTVRMYFWKGKSATKATVSLRNAELGADNSFAVAHKGFESFEWRTTVNISGTRSYIYGIDAGGEQTGSISGTDTIYLDSGASLFMEGNDWDASSEVVPPTTDSGWQLILNDNTGSPVDSGNNSVAQAIAGYADIRNASGVGMSIGVYQMAAYWPKSLEFASGGSLATVGIWARQNSEAYYQQWPQYSTHDLYFNFHHEALSTAKNEFLKWQHALIARAPYTHYNDTGAFGMFKMAAPADEQAFYEDAKASGTPSMSGFTAWPYLDETTNNGSWNIQAFRVKAWNDPGGGNQLEYGYSHFFNWITRGMTGRYVDAMQFYHFVIDSAFPHSDGFTWVGQSGINAIGRPSRTSANSAEVHGRDVTWVDQSHAHWYGLTSYYFMTGDERAKDALLDGIQEYYSHNFFGHFPTDGRLSTSRSVGIFLLGYARMAEFLADVGISNSTVLTNGTALYTNQVKPVMCPQSDEDAGYCTFTPNPGNLHEDSVFGTSRLRGAHWSGGSLGNWCGATGLVYRNSGDLFSAIVAHGILEFRAAKGAAWADYWEALDLAYGITRVVLEENWEAFGDGQWDEDGYHPWVLLDHNSNDGDVPDPDCPPDDSNYEITARATLWMLYYTQWLVDQNTDWLDQFTLAVQKLIAASGVSWPELGNYQISTLVANIEDPSPVELQDVYINTFTHLGSGTYRLQWAVPDGTTSYRIKWSDKTIVDWIGFNERTFDFIGDPATQTNWFAATNAASGEIPTPGAAGSQQSTTVATGDTGLTLENFSVKAYYPRVEDGAPSLTWSTMSTSGDVPNPLNQVKHHYDPVSGRVLAYLMRSTGSGIYSTDIFALASNTGVFTRIGGTGSPSHACTNYPADTPGGVDDGSGSDLQPWLSDRHPDHRSALMGGFYWQSGGLVCGDIPNDVLKMALNADPTDNTTAKLTPATDDAHDTNSSMAADPTHDVLLLFGTRGSGATISVKAYCPTASSLSAPQSAAGCTQANTWADEVYADATATSPPRNSIVNADVFYDATLDKILIFKNLDESGTWSNTVWEYDVESKTMTNQNPTGAPSNQSSTMLESLTVPITGGRWKGKYLYVRTSHRNSNDGQSGVWIYDPVARSFTQLSTSGTGPEVWTNTVFDPSVGTDGAVIAQDYAGVWRKGAIQ
jgi:hypothetical protein